jgi:hypothetical protein
MRLQEIINIGVRGKTRCNLYEYLKQWSLEAPKMYCTRVYQFDIREKGGMK